MNEKHCPDKAPAILLITKYFSYLAPAREAKYNALVAEMAKYARVVVLSPSEPLSFYPRYRFENVSFVIYRYLGFSLRKLYYYLSRNGKRIRNSTRKSDNSLLSKLNGWTQPHLDWLHTFLFPDAYLFCIPKGFLKGFRIMKQFKCNVIITGCYPFSNLAIGQLLKMFYPQLKWVIELRDPFCNNPFIRPAKWWRKRARKLELKAFENCDQIWIYKGWFPDGLGYFAENYPHLYSKVIELPYCGYDESIFDGCHEVKENKQSSGFHVVHAGNFYGGDYSPVDFLRSVALLVGKNQWPSGGRISFYGHFCQEDWRIVESLGLEGIVSHYSYVPYSQIGRVLCKANLLLWIGGIQRSYPDNIPSKVFDYIGSGVPILAVLPKGAAHDFAVRESIGYIAEASNVPDITRKLLICIGDWRSGDLRNNCIRREDYSLRNQVRQAGRLLRGLLE